MVTTDTNPLARDKIVHARMMFLICPSCRQTMRVKPNEYLHRKGAPHSLIYCSSACHIRHRQTRNLKRAG